MNDPTVPALARLIDPEPLRQVWQLAQNDANFVCTLLFQPSMVNTSCSLRNHREIEKQISGYVSKMIWRLTFSQAILNRITALPFILAGYRMQRLAKLLSLFLTATASLAGPAAAQSKVVWQGNGWDVYATISGSDIRGCHAIKGFTSTHNASRAAAWGFILTIDGQWGLAIRGPAAERMIGRPALLSVDDQPIHSVIPTRSPSGLIVFGQLPVDGIAAIAKGVWLMVANGTNSTRYHLRGSEAALAETLKCSVAAREVAARGPGTSAPSSHEAQRDRTTGLTAGTGFFVSSSGQILTNAHVVRGCSALRVRRHGDAAFISARVQGADVTHDLALLALAERPTAAPQVLPWRSGVRLGEQIAIFGYPYIGTLASTGTFTRGDVTALAGLGNNSAHFQLSAPVQPGNSGGPVVDETGQVVGVVVAKLDALKMAADRGDIPQNVNFAIKSAQASSFLEAHGVVTSVTSSSTTKLSGPDIAERLQAASVLVVCSRDVSGR